MSTAEPCIVILVMDLELKCSCQAEGRNPITASHFCLTRQYCSLLCETIHGSASNFPDD